MQIEPLQSSFSVAALLGDKLLQKTNTDINRKKEDDGNARPGLPPTPQPSDSEEDEPLRKRKCVEQCELAKVNIVLFANCFLHVCRTLFFDFFFSTRD